MVIAIYFMKASNKSGKNVSNELENLLHDCNKRQIAVIVVVFSIS